MKIRTELFRDVINKAFLLIFVIDSAHDLKIKYTIYLFKYIIKNNLSIYLFIIL